MSEYLTIDPKNLTVDPARLAGVNSVNFGVNSEIYKNHTIDPSYSGRVNSEINCCNTFDDPDREWLELAQDGIWADWFQWGRGWAADCFLRPPTLTASNF